MISSSYFLLALFGFYLATLNKSASPIWLASGLSLVALIQFGPRISMGIFLGAFFANFYNGSSFLLSSLISFGNLGEALGAYALYKFFKSKPNYFGDIAKTLLIVTLSLLPTLISAFIGISALHFFDLITTNPLVVFITWWIGDCMGVLIILPLYLHFTEPTISRKRNPDISNLVTKFWLYCTFILTFTIIFFFPTDSVYSMFFYPFLLLSIWICGERSTYIFTFIIAIIGSILTSHHLGPFAEGDTNSNLIKFQFFIGSITLTALTLEYLFRINEIKWSSLALIGSWILTGFTFYAFNSAYDKEKHKEFISLTEKAQLEVQKKLDLYFSLLESGVGLYAASDDVTEQDWKQFVTILNLKDKYPGLHGLGVIFEVPDAELKSHATKYNLNIKTINIDNSKNHIPTESQVNWNQQSHYIITYVEPLEANRAALGLDIASEKNRREAANLAKKFKSRTITRAIHLVQDNQKRNGFLIFSPFYKDQQISGFIYAPVILEQFLSSALISYHDNLNLSVYSVEPPEDEESLALKTLLYSSHKEKFLKYKKSNTLQLAGNDFIFQWSQSTLNASSNYFIDSIVSFFGSIFSLFLAISLANLKNLSQKANEIAEQKTTQLKQTQLQLVSAARLSSLGLMASGVAHEINNPLSIISGRSRLILKILEKEPSPENLETIKNYADNIINTTERVVKIVKSMRSLARDGEKDEMKSVPLANIVNAVLDICKEKLKNSHISITIDPIPDISITCREVQIGQVLINLINNAYDAIEKNSEKWIKISFAQIGSQISIKVTDSGHGIDKEIANKLMIPFFTTKDPGRGTGLGLSISRSIVEDHEGKLEIDMQNVNTCFVMTLPQVPSKTKNEFQQPLAKAS